MSELSRNCCHGNASNSGQHLKAGVQAAAIRAAWRIRACAFSRFHAGGILQLVYARAAPSCLQSCAMLIATQHTRPLAALQRDGSSRTGESETEWCATLDECLHVVQVSGGHSRDCAGHGAGEPRVCTNSSFYNAPMMHRQNRSSDRLA